MPTTTLPDADAPETLDIVVEDAVVGLRCIVGLRPCEPPPREDIPEHVPAHLVARVDARGWIAWAVIGLQLLSRDMPTLRELMLEVRRFAATIAMRRTGANITHAALLLDTSRRSLRHLVAPKRALPPAGTRVVAIERIEPDPEDPAGPDIVSIFGHGEYVGQDRPPNGTRTRFGVVGPRWRREFVVPEIILDDGNTVWGAQCTWMLEAEFEKRHGDAPVRVVPLPKMVPQVPQVPQVEE
jgi:hypothetical protein